jgi:hypothetical protein
MNNTAVMIPENQEIISALVLNGDLSRLNPGQKVQYYGEICSRIGLDPMMQPFKLLKLSGKEVLYCDRSGAQQLNRIHGVSHRITAREIVQDCYIVTAQASLPTGRMTESIGAVSIGNLKGDPLCNAMMKAETKAKRRATLDLLGLGMLDETEISTIPNAQSLPAPVHMEPKSELATPATRNAILMCVQSHVFSAEEKEKAKAFCMANPTEQKAHKFLLSLRNHEKERKEIEKAEKESLHYPDEPGSHPENA